MNILFRYILLIFILSFNLWAHDSPSRWYTVDADKKVIINVELFLSSTCVHCQKADAFFRETKPSWLHIQRYVINTDKKALLRFNDLLNNESLNDFSIPSVFFCNSRWVGFAEASSTGKDLLHAMNYCKESIEKNGKLTTVTTNVLKHWANSNRFNSEYRDKTSALKYIPAAAFIDAFNPCAWFCIAGFVAILFLQKLRINQLFCGLIFIVTVGAVHYFQQAYASSFYELLPGFRLPAVGVGLFTLYFVVLYCKNKPQDYLFFVLAFVLAFMVQCYQQTCIMNLSYVFQQWLYNQHLSKGVIGFYQLSYQLLYITPLLFMLFLYLFFSRATLFIHLNKKLKTISLLFLSVLALFLIIYPNGLSNLTWSILISITLCIVGWFLSRFNLLFTNRDSDTPP